MDDEFFHRVRRQAVIEIEVHYQRRLHRSQREIPGLIDRQGRRGCDGFGVQPFGHGIAAVEDIEHLDRQRLESQIVAVTADQFGAGNIAVPYRTEDRDPGRT